MDRVKQLALVRKVAAEIKNHWGLDDKDLAEFICDLGQNEAENWQDFSAKLSENGADCTDEFAQHLYNLIQKMAPPRRVQPGSNANQGLLVVGSGAASSSSSASLAGMVMGGGAAVRAPRDEKEAQFVGLRLPDSAPEDRPELGAAFIGNTERDKGDYGETARSLLESEMTERERRDAAKGKGKKGKDGKKGGFGSSSSNANMVPLGGDRRDRERSPRRDPSSAGGPGHRSREDAIRALRRKPLEKWEIYAGEVQKLMDYGAFISIDTSDGRKEGLCHAQFITKNQSSADAGAASQRPDQLLQRKQEVFVKVVALTEKKISLSMVEVDQDTAADLKPRDPETGLPLRMKNNPAPGFGNGAAESRKAQSDNSRRTHGEHTGVSLNIPDTLGGRTKDRNTKKLNDYDRWENQQLVASGVIKKTERADYDVHTGGFLVEEEAEEEYEVDVKDQEPAFLTNQTAKSGAQLSPIRLVKMPEGSMAQAAGNAAAAIKETRQARDAIQQQNAQDVIPKDMIKEGIILSPFS